jgi:hypothetical protein
MQTLQQHLRFATRQPVECPGVALSAVFSRAFGMGATMAGLSVVYGLLLHGLATSAYGQQSPSGSVSVVQPGAPGTPSRRLPASTSGVAPHPSRADIEFMQGMMLNKAIARAQTSHLAKKDRAKLPGMATSVETGAAAARNSTDAGRLHALALILQSPTA